MKKIRKINLIVVFLLLVIPQTICAQNVVVNITNLKIFDNKLEIRYDILNSKKMQRFDVGVEITDLKGNPVKAESFRNDYGQNQTGGKDKVIKWDYEKDGIVMSDKLKIIVTAIPIIVKGAVKPGNAIIKSIVLRGGD